MSPTHAVTLLLEKLSRGESGSADALMEQVYHELRLLAAGRMARESPGQNTLQATALVHEAWLRLVDEQGRAQFQNRAHFFGAAAEAMRRILIDRARRRQALRHGGGQERVDVQDLEIAAPAPDGELLAVHEALDRLAVVEPQKAELVKLRYFAGLSIEDAASALSISPATAKRWWAYARAWLFQELEGPAQA